MLGSVVGSEVSSVFSTGSITFGSGISSFLGFTSSFFSVGVITVSVWDFFNEPLLTLKLIELVEDINSPDTDWVNIWPLSLSLSTLSK